MQEVVGALKNQITNTIYRSNIYTYNVVGVLKME